MEKGKKRRELLRHHRYHHPKDSFVLLLLVFLCMCGFFPIDFLIVASNLSFWSRMQEGAWNGRSVAGNAVGKISVQDTNQLISAYPHHHCHDSHQGGSAVP
jgi:hypothetical protein